MVFLVSGVKGFLDLNGLTRLLVYVAFGLWCFRVSGALFFGCGVLCFGGGCFFCARGLASTYAMQCVREWSETGAFESEMLMV